MSPATFPGLQCFKSTPSERYHVLFHSRCKSRPKVVPVELGQAAIPSSPYARDRFRKAGSGGQNALRLLSFLMRLLHGLLSLGQVDFNSPI